MKLQFCRRCLLVRVTPYDGPGMRLWLREKAGIEERGLYGCTGASGGAQQQTRHQWKTLAFQTIDRNNSPTTLLYKVKPEPTPPGEELPRAVIRRDGGAVIVRESNGNVESFEAPPWVVEAIRSWARR
jgi:hypothetical protein